jgi:hypothetical protein
MSERKMRLEAALDEIRADVKAIRFDLAEIKARFQMSRLHQLVFMQAALTLAIFAGAFGILKLASSH